MRRQPGKPDWKQSVQDADSFFFAPIDFFVEDLGRAKFHTDAFTEASLSEKVEAATEVGDDDIRELSQTGRGKVKKNPRGAIGKAVAIAGKKK